MKAFKSRLRWGVAQPALECFWPSYDTMCTMQARIWRRQAAKRCSVCTGRIWFCPIPLAEPEGVPEPRLSWLLCKYCYKALLVELGRSPILSPLRLRIAIGLVAADRSPSAYPTRIRTYISDRKWLVFIAVGFIIAMIVHLALIVAIAPLSR